MRKLIFSLTFLLMANLALAQQGTGEGVLIEKPIGLLDLLEEHQKFIKEKKHAGFRVQIYSGTTKFSAFEARKRLEADYPDLKSYIEFESPYYKLRVGNYRDRFSAYAVYKQLILDFPGAAIYPSEIEIFLPQLSEVEDSQAIPPPTDDNEEGDDDGN